MATNKRIWIINQYAATPETGQGGRHYYFSKILAKLGYDVYLIVASYTHFTPEAIEFNGDFKVKDIDKNLHFVWVNVATYNDAHSKQRLINWFTFGWKLTKLDKTLPKPDIILYSSPSLVGYLGAERVAKKLKVPLAFEVRDIWPLTLCEIGGYSKRHPFIKLLEQIEKRAYKNSEFIISNLKNSYQHMQSLGMDPKKFTWIPNGFMKDIVENSEPLEQKTIDQLPKDKFIVGYAGTFGVANSLDTFINAAAKLKSHTDIAFVLVGKGKLKNELIQQAQDLKLDNVYFVDAIPKIQVQTILQKFDVCYIGLTKDPLFRFGVSPNKLFDYLYSGRPIIYAIDSGQYTPVTDARAGIQVPPENEEGIVNAVLELYHASPEEREKMGGNGHIEALKSYEFESLTNKLTSVLFGEKCLKD